MDELRAKWREELFSSHQWRFDNSRDPDNGALSGVWLRGCAGAPFGGYMKPTTEPCAFPVAAREKVAADLAFELRVPAVPVLLYDSNGQFGAVQEECCVSMRLYAEVLPWQIALSGPMTSSKFGPAIATQATADSFPNRCVRHLDREY
jgi:hypothetical protein